MTAPGKPWPDARLRALRQRHTRPPWLTPAGITSVLGLMGLAVYVCLYAFAAAVLEEFGTSPEEVGITQARLLSRAGALGLALTCAAVTIALVLSVLLVGIAWGLRRAAATSFLRPVSAWTRVRDRWPRLQAVERWMRRSDHVWSSGEAGRLRRITWVIALTCSLVFLLVAELAYPGFATTSVQGGDTDVAYTAYVVVLFAGCFGLIARWRHALALSVFAVLVVGWALFGAVEAGASAAERVRAGDVDASLMDLLGFPAERVCVTWAGARPASVPEDADIQLGSAGGFLLLTDGQLVYRVNAAQISVVTVAERSDEARQC
jgi:hypothetical protein